MRDGAFYFRPASFHPAYFYPVAVWFIGLACAAPVLAEPSPPVAIIEDATSQVTSLAPLDLLRAGDEISLAPDEGVIISYLNSCRRENIRGGHVVIGETESAVRDGTVSRESVACDPMALALTPAQANQSGALAFRGEDAKGDPIADQAKFAMETRHPIVLALDITSVTLEDLRDPGKVRTIEAAGGIIELTTPDAPLAKGGVYKLTGGGRSLVFRIGREATDAPLPLLKRLIRF